MINRLSFFILLFFVFIFLSCENKKNEAQESNNPPVLTVMDADPLFPLLEEGDKAFTPLSLAEAENYTPLPQSFFQLFSIPPNVVDAYAVAKYNEENVTNYIVGLRVEQSVNLYLYVFNRQTQAFSNLFMPLATFEGDPASAYKLIKTWRVSPEKNGSYQLIRREGKFSPNGENRTADVAVYGVVNGSLTQIGVANLAELNQKYTLEEVK